MRRALLIVGASLLLGLGIVGASHAADPPKPPVTASPNDDLGALELAATANNDNSNGGAANDATQDAGSASTTNTGATQEPSVIWKQGDLSCDTYSGAGCVTPNRCDDGSIPITWTLLNAATGEILGTTDQCPEDPPPSADTTPTPPVDIPGAVLRAFERVELPESAINVQPPGGETLVNLPTILSTSAERHQIPVRLAEVDLDITLEVWPSSFVWHHGDDTSQETTTPGKAWTEGADMADLITHTYATTSDGLDLSVDTTWSAQFKVAGQPNWRPVNGTVSITGDAVTVAVLEAKPQLVR